VRPAGADELLARLAADLADQVAQRYRIDPATRPRWNPGGQAGPAPAGSRRVPPRRRPPEVLRLRIYRDAAAGRQAGTSTTGCAGYRAAETAFDDAVHALAGLPPGSPPHLITERVTAVAVGAREHRRAAAAPGRLRRGA